MGKLLEELKRRKVIKVSAVYAVVAWLLIQVAATVFPALQMPDWTVSFVTILFILGFPIAIILSWAYEAGPRGVHPDPGAEAPVQVSPAQNQWLIYATFVLVLVVAGFQVGDRFLGQAALVEESVSASTGQNNAVTRVSVRIPDDEFFDSLRGDFDISPDGSFLIYRGNDEENNAQFWIRQWNQLNGRPLRHTGWGTRPRISPDGTEIVFADQGAIRIVSVQGGVNRTLVETGGDTPEWSPDGEWIYFRSDEGINRIPSIGGSIEAVATVNRDNGEEAFVFVDALPNGELLYGVQMADNTSKIQAASPTTGQVKDLALGKHPIYTSEGYLLFQSNDEPTLLAAPFNLEAMELTGPPITIAENLLLVGTGSVGNVAVSNNGRLVYRTGDTAGNMATPVWVDRTGRATEIDANWIIQSTLGQGLPSLSPSGDRLTVSINAGRGGDSDIWIKYFDGPLSRITFDEAGFHPNWSPDGQHVVYPTTSGISGPGYLWRKRADGLGPAELLVESEHHIRSGFMSADGNWIVYRDLPTGNGSGAIYAVSTEPGSEPTLLINNGFEVSAPTLSPDGRWLAYISDESGRFEVYVQPFPDVDTGRWQLSADGGEEPVWANNGRELFYRNGNNELVVVNLEIVDTFDWRDQQVLFSTEGYRSTRQNTAYGISSDDQRFLMMRFEPADDTELIMVENWAEELRQLTSGSN